MLMSAFRAGLLGLGPWGIWGIKTAQFDLSAACERPVWARRWVANPEYIEALCVNPMCPIRICHKWVCLGLKRPHFDVLFDGETDRVGKFIFCKKKAHMTKKCQITPLSPPKVGQFFFPVVPKFTPRKSDRKGVGNTGAHTFYDIWAFGGPDLVKNSTSGVIFFTQFFF